MNIEYYQRMFEYDEWANQKVLAALQAGKNLPGKTVTLLAHILAAGQIWHTRLQEKDSSQFDVWPEYSLDECESLIETTNQNWNAYLEKLAPEKLSETVTYRNSKGVAYESVVGNILSHVIIHGGYHRGQIAMLLRQTGNDPAITDFIAFERF